MWSRLGAATSVVTIALALSAPAAGAGDDGGTLPDDFDFNFGDPADTTAIPFPDLDPDPAIPDGFDFNFGDPADTTAVPDGFDFDFGDPDTTAIPFPDLEPDQAIPFPDLGPAPPTVPDGFDFDFGDPDTTATGTPFPDLSPAPPTVPDGFDFNFGDPADTTAIPFPEIGEPAAEVVDDPSPAPLPPVADPSPADRPPADTGPGIPFPELHDPAPPVPVAPQPEPQPSAPTDGPITISTIATSVSDAVDAVELPVILLAGVGIWIVVLALVLAAFNSRQVMHSISGVKEGAFVPAYHRPGGGDAKTMAFAFRHNSVKIWQAGPGRRKRKRRWLPVASPVGRVWVDRSLTRPAHRAPDQPEALEPDESEAEDPENAQPQADEAADRPPADTTPPDDEAPSGTAAPAGHAEEMSPEAG